MLDTVTEIILSNEGREYVSDIMSIVDYSRTFKRVSSTEMVNPRSFGIVKE